MNLRIGCCPCAGPTCTLAGCGPLPTVLHGSDEYGAFTLTCSPAGGSTWLGTHRINYVACNGCGVNVNPFDITYSLQSSTVLKATYKVSTGTCPGTAGFTTHTFSGSSGACSPLALTFTGGPPFVLCATGSVTITP